MSFASTPLSAEMRARGCREYALETKKFVANETGGIRFGCMQERQATGMEYIRASGYTPDLVKAEANYHGFGSLSGKSFIRPFIEELLQSSKTDRLDFTFPESESLPSEFPELLKGVSVSFPISCDLLLPVLPIGFRNP
jgi:hypothetical protein